MPRPLTPEQKRARLRRFFAELDWAHLDVNDYVDRELSKALAVYREIDAGNVKVPESVREYVVPDAPERAAEALFEVGFMFAATAFWDDLLRSRERLRSALKGSRIAAADRGQVATEFKEAVRRAAITYRRRRPYDRRNSSTHQMARDIATELQFPDPRADDIDRQTKSPAAVRHVLKNLGIK